MDIPEGCKVNYFFCFIHNSSKICLIGCQLMNHFNINHGKLKCNDEGTLKAILNQGYQFYIETFSSLEEMHSLEMCRTCLLWTSWSISQLLNIVSWGELLLFLTTNCCQNIETVNTVTPDPGIILALNSAWLIIIMQAPAVKSISFSTWIILHQIHLNDFQPLNYIQALFPFSHKLDITACKNTCSMLQTLPVLAILTWK